jgi:hypothetical protein
MHGLDWMQSGSETPQFMLQMPFCEQSWIIGQASAQFVFAVPHWTYPRFPVEQLRSTAVHVPLATVQDTGVPVPQLAVQVAFISVGLAWSTAPFSAEDRGKTANNTTSATNTSLLSMYSSSLNIRSCECLRVT